MTITAGVLAWRASLVALCSATLIHRVRAQDDAEPHDTIQISNWHTTDCPRTSSRIVAILMALALTWALFEYVQLAWMLITDTEAVHICYEQHCSVAQMKEEQTRDQLMSRQRAAGEAAHAIRDIAATHHSTTWKDPISTNMLVTPSQLSDDNDVESVDTHRSQHDPHESTSAETSICACQEEDYLVALEDDVRRPCIEAIASHPMKAESAMKPSERTKEEARGPAEDITHQQEEALHHFKDELLPAAETTPIDCL